ncbi:MAG: hypothetical protein HY880_07520, partial [Deltaproteobacteria bacterium]|nr:hypothetical protein [Deltaproteobacteria bacterium]
MSTRLIEILGLETALYSDLLNCLQEEKKLLLRRSKEELYELASRMEALVYKIKDI